MSAAEGAANGPTSLEEELDRLLDKLDLNKNYLSDEDDDHDEDLLNDLFKEDYDDDLRLGDHQVPPEVKRAYETTSVHSVPVMFETLSESNYKNKFRNLLWWDELKESHEKGACDESMVKVEPENEEEKRKRLLDEARTRAMQTAGDQADGGALGEPDEVDNITLYKVQLRKSPCSLKKMDEVGLCSRQTSDTYRGTVFKTRAKYVYFTLDLPTLSSSRMRSDSDETESHTSLFFPKKSPGNPININHNYDVTFSISRIPLSRCHEALTSFYSKLWLQRALFPPATLEPKRPLIDASDLRSPATDKSSLLSIELNERQLDAAINILESTCRPSPYILFGPPGTGKTATIVEIIRLIHKRQPHYRILVCGTSNDSTDVLARAIYKWVKLEQYDGKGGLVRKLVRLSAKNRMRDVPGDIRRITTHIERLRKLWEEGMSCSIYVTTCSQSAALIPMQFDYVFVDEAGSAKEPEALIPITLLSSSGAAVLAGDPKQLGPTCQSDVAKNYGLGLSMLERLYQLPMYGGDRPMRGGNFDSRCITMLSVCYRCDERLLKVNNQLFYFNELTFVEKPRDSLLDWMGGGSPLMFCKCISGEHRKQSAGTSLYNDAEAALVLKLVKKLYRFGLMSEQVGVATPYRGQVINLIGTFKKDNTIFCKIETMEKFQGDEREVMIITTVRTADGRKTSDFFRDPRRFNVATSRAKRLVILVGDSQLLRQDEYWAKYIENAAEITV